MPVEYTCLNCGKVFYRPPSAKAKYCSVDCRNESYAKEAIENGSRIKAKCSVCGKPFVAKKSEIERGRKCCSTECRYKQVGLTNSKRLSGRIFKRDKRICPVCHTEFEVWPCSPKRFCSRDCANKSPERSKLARKKAKAQWANPESRKLLKQGIRKRSQSDTWRSSPHFQRGTNHPRYTGGRRKRAIEYSRYKYKVWRTTIYERDNYTCQDCGKRGGKLNAHHIKPWKQYPSLRYEISNGITLCWDCHKKAHGWH